MQGGKNILDYIPDAIDLNRVSVSGRNSNAMNHSAAWDNLLNPVENRLSNYMLSSGETSADCTSSFSNNARRFSGWDAGESSSGAQDYMHDDLKVGQGWSTSVSSCTSTDAMQEDQPEQSYVLRSERENTYDGNHANGRPLTMSNFGSNSCSGNVDLDSGDMDNGDYCWEGSSARCYFPSRAERHEGLRFDSSTKNTRGSCSSSLYRMENSEESGSSLGAPESSGKRKALEGCPTLLYPGGNSTSYAHAENVTGHNFPAHLNTTARFIPSPPVCWPYSSQPERMNSGIGVGLRETSSEIFPLSRITDFPNAAMNVGGRLNDGHQEQSMFSFPLIDAALGSSSNQSSRSFASSESSMLIDSPYHPSQSHGMHVTGYSGSMLPYPCNGSIDSQRGSSLNPIMLSRDRGAIFQDEQNSRSNLRNSRDLPSFVMPSERRHLVQDSPSSNLALGSSHSSRSLLPSSRSGSSSRTLNLPTGRTADQNLAAPDQQSSTDYAPWALFPRVEPDDGNQRFQFPEYPSSVEAEILSFGSRRRQHQSSRPALEMDAPTDAIRGWRALAVDLEGRQRLIRQVRNAVRRHDSWRAQDSTALGPFINDEAELHDRHSDMRLDVDSMSYEELLSLEERIGNVSTGLNEEIIMKSMKQRKYQAIKTSSNDEPCCICQEEYVTGDDIGIAACGHEFHTGCIKQWLSLKNLCPICKMTALET